MLLLSAYQEIPGRQIRKSELAGPGLLGSPCSNRGAQGVGKNPLAEMEHFVAVPQPSLSPECITGIGVIKWLLLGLEFMVVPEAWVPWASTERTEPVPFRYADSDLSLAEPLTLSYDGHREPPPPLPARFSLLSLPWVAQIF